MWFTQISSLAHLLACKRPKTGPISVVSNYDFKNADDFKALAFVTWESYLLAILNEVVLKNLPDNKPIDEKINNFFHKMFTMKKYKAIVNIYKFIEFNRVELLKIKFDQYGFNFFIVNGDRNKQDYFLYLNKMFYKFIDKYKKTMMKNKSLINFYTICSYKFNILHPEYTLKGINTRINYHSINELNDENISKIFTDFIKVDMRYEYRLGFFILPVFDNGNRKFSIYKKIFDAIKILGGVVEKQKTKMLQKNKNEDVYTFFLRQYIVDPGFVESNFNVLRNSHIYNKLEGCFWMMDGFYIYNNLHYYIDAKLYCNPNDYKFKTFENINTSSIIEGTDPQNSLNVIEEKTHTVYISSNFFIDEIHQKEANHLQNVQNIIVLALLNYTVLKMALETFEFDINERKLNYYFDKIEIAREDIGKESIKESEAIDNYEAKKTIEEDNKQSSKNAINKEDTKKTKQKLSKFFYETRDQIINEESTLANFSKKDEEVVEERIGKNNYYNIQEESEYDNDEISNPKGLDICLIVYREITMVFDKLMIENIENFFSIYRYVYNVFVSLRENNLLNKKCIEAFYKNFFNKVLRIDLFNTKKNENKNCKIPPYVPLREGIINFLPTIVEELKVDDMIDYIDIDEKILKIIDKNSKITTLTCDSNYAFLTIIMKHGLNAVLTGVASQKTTMEFYFYLVDIILKLNLKNNYYNNNNFLRENNTIFISKKYESINFQTFVKQEIENKEFNNMKPSIFYFNFYSIYGCELTISWPYMLRPGLQRELIYILSFSNSFLEEERAMKICHVFVFNVFYLQNNLLDGVVNVEDKSDYGIRLAREHENISKFLKDNNFKFPRCFIIKHQNMELTMDTVTYDGQPLSFYYKPITT